MRCTCRWFKLTHILCCDPKMPTSYLCILGLVFHNKLPACRASCANPWLKHTCLNQRIVTIMITTDTKHISHTHHCKNQTSPPSINCEHCGTNSLRAANTSNYAVIMKPIRCLWKTTSHVAFQPDSQRQLPAASIRCFLKGWSKKEIQHIHAKCRISMGFVFDLNKKPSSWACSSCGFCPAISTVMPSSHFASTTASFHFEHCAWTWKKYHNTCGESPTNIHNSYPNFTSRYCCVEMLLSQSRVWLWTTRI